MRVNKVNQEKFMKLRSLLVATLSTLLVVSFADANPKPTIAPATASAQGASKPPSPVASPKPKTAAAKEAIVLGRPLTARKKPKK